MMNKQKLRKLNNYSYDLISINKYHLLVEDSSFLINDDVLMFAESL